MKPRPHFLICVINFVKTALRGLSLIGLGSLGRVSRSAVGCLDLDFPFFPALAALRARREGRTRVMPVEVGGEFSPATSKSSISTGVVRRNQRRSQMASGVPETYRLWKLSGLGLEH